MRRRGVLAACLALAFALLETACSAPIPAPFRLTAEDGTEHLLYPDSRMPKGMEGMVGGAGRASVRYTLDTPVELDDPSPALELRYALAGACRLELYAPGSREQPFLAVDLAEGPGLVEWILPLSTGAKLAAIRFTAEEKESPRSAEQSPAGKGGDGAQGQAGLEILGMRVLTSEYGFQRTPEGARFSQGASLSRSGARGFEVLRVEHSLGPKDQPVVELCARTGRIRLRVEGGRTAHIALSKEETLLFPLDALGGYGAVAAEAEDQGSLVSLFVRPLAYFEGPIPVDLGTVLACPAPSDPEAAYALFRWDVFPQVLIFDFRDYAGQDAYLKRLAFFVEKEGFRGRLARDSEIAKMHAWNAHDYRAEDLASFFEKARQSGFSLHQEELELRGILEKRGILVVENGRILPGKGAIVSISRESSPYLRRLFLNHEASHGLFFQDEAYRQLAKSRWSGQDATERRFWNLFLSNRDYDPTDAYLSYNEFQAYMTQQPVSQLEDWLKDVAYARLAKSYPERADAILADLKASIPGFTEDAAALDAYLRRSYGFRAGSLERVRYE